MSALRRRMIHLSLALVVCLGSALSAWAQYDSVFDSPASAGELRLGVQAYHQGRYAESILLFEKSLAYAPREPLVLYWLGRAYLKNGFSETAMRAWQPLLDAADAPPFLRAKADYVRNSRSLEPSPDRFIYVQAARFEGRAGGAKLFSRPSTLLPMRDGSVFIVSHGSDELVRMDGSGVIRSRLTGGLAGFSRPFGLAALPDGTLFLSEFGGDRLARIAPDGSLRLLGQKGKGPGQFLGPQFLAADSAGYIYVSDYGNARVVKLDSEGAHILSFGGQKIDEGFPGLRSPAGLAVKDGVVYVADSLRRSVYRFDESGNYLGALADGSLVFPEGLSFWQGGQSLLVADSSRLVSIDLATETQSEIYRSADKKAKLFSAAADYNGNILVCDFDASALMVLTESARLAFGYNVEIERVYADRFPKVELDVSVRDRWGNPVVGLREPNFYLTERVSRVAQSDERGKALITTELSIEPVDDYVFLGSGQNTQALRATIMLERSAAMNGRRQELREALSALYRVLGGQAGTEGGIAAMVSAAATPSMLRMPDIDTALRAALSPAAGQGRFDLGLRLAASSLMPARPRDALVYVGGGAVDESSFVGTTMSELAAFLRNNDIRFYAVVLDEPSLVLRYMAERSGGAIYSASRPRGLGDLGADIAGGASGRYRLGFSSKANPVFGQAYLSVGVEAYLYKKSGKDELGYYAPLR